jgi:hypothetical protein
MIRLAALSLAVVIVSLGLACGDSVPAGDGGFHGDTAHLTRSTVEICLDLEQESCRVDKLCGNLDPCSFACARLPLPRDPEGLRGCVAAYKAIAVPDSDIVARGHACALRSMQQLKCLLFFLP